MMGRKEAASDKAGELYQFLLTKFKGYPEFTRDILHALLPLLPEDDVARRLRVFEATFQVYRANPEIVVSLMMELASYLQEQGSARAAVATYQAIVRRYRDQGHLVEQALASAETIARKQHALWRILEMYEQVYAVYREREDDAVVHGREAYTYRYAGKLAALYHEAGNDAKAAEYGRICERINREIEAREKK
jgi:hypothetical protein